MKQMTRQESPPSHQTEKTKQMLYLKIINKKEDSFPLQKDAEIIDNSAEKKNLSGQG